MNLKPVLRIILKMNIHFCCEFILIQNYKIVWTWLNRSFSFSPFFSSIFRFHFISLCSFLIFNINLNPIRSTHSSNAFLFMRNVFIVISFHGCINKCSPPLITWFDFFLFFCIHVQCNTDNGCNHCFARIRDLITHFFEQRNQKCIKMCSTLFLQLPLID